MKLFRAVGACMVCLVWAAHSFGADMPPKFLLISNSPPVVELDISAFHDTKGDGKAFTGTGALVLEDGAEVALDGSQKYNAKKDVSAYRFKSGKGATCKVSIQFSTTGNPERVVKLKLSMTTADKRKISISDASLATLALPRFPAPKSQTVAGSIILPAGCPIAPATLTVWSIMGSATVAADGTFSAFNVINEGADQVIFVKNNQGALVMVGYILSDNVVQGTVRIGTEEMAQGLVVINPYVSILPQDKRRQILTEIAAHADFPALLAAIRDALINTPNNVLDYETNPQLYLKAVKIGIDVIAAHGDNDLQRAYRSIMGPPSTAAVGDADDPHIEDIVGPNVTFVNPKMTFEGIHILAYEGSPDNVALIRGKGSLVSVNWGWPPVVPTPPCRLGYSLGEGRYTITFYKGFNTSEAGWLDFGTAQGKATYANTLRCVGIVMDIVGLPIKLQDDTIYFMMSLPPPTDVDLSDLGDVLWEQADWKGLLLKTMPKFIVDHNVEILLWVYESWPGNDPSTAINCLITVLDGVENVIPVAKMLSLGINATNDYIPFAWDLLTAKDKIVYEVLQEGGVLTEVSTLVPPTPYFNMTPATPSAGDMVQFDASSSYDADHPTAVLSFRWDFNADGIWDTAWSTTPTASHTFAQRGNYRPVLQARDSDNLTASVSHDIVVGLNDGLKIVLTWGAMPTDLDSHLYTPNIGGSTYHIYYLNKGSATSNPFAWLDLDDTSSYGPETVWIEKRFPGTYTYSVYQYSSSGSILTSSAVVRVLNTQGEVATFSAPTTGVGRWWNVFSMDGTTGAITPINTISASASDSVGAWRLDPMPPK